MAAARGRPPAGGILTGIARPGQLPIQFLLTDIECPGAPRPLVAAPSRITGSRAVDLPPTTFGLATASIVSGVLAIAVHGATQARRVLFYIFKPLTTGIILAIGVLAATRVPSIYTVAIPLGLLLSLGGDIWLMLPSDRFIAGLVTFLLALLCYCVAFVGAGALNAVPWVILPVAALGIAILAYLWPALSRRLKLPVTIYMVAMVTMAGLACARALAQPSGGAILAAIGAVLFLTSDAIMALNRFRRPFAFAQVLILSSYYGGQLLIALSTTF